MQAKVLLAPTDNFLDQLFKNKGDLIALQEGDQSLSFSELRKKVEERALRLKNYGILPGERIVYPFPNGIESVINYLSILSSGATVVLLDPNLSKEDLHQLILFSEPVALVGEFHSDIPSLSLSNLSFQKPYQKPKTREPPDPEVAMILYTSGTTGDYKGVLITHENLGYTPTIVQSVCKYPLGPGVVAECFLPIYHVFPLIVNLLGFMTIGATVRFHPIQDVGKVLKEGGPFITTIVPRVLELLEKKIREEIQSLSLTTKIFKWLLRYFRKKIPRHFMCGGAPIPLTTHKNLLKYGFSIQVGYGLTESCAAGTVNQDKHKFNSVGQVAPFFQIRIDRPNSSGEGEICLKGKTVMKGYLKDPKASCEALQDGWLHTGDLGKLDEEGFLFITGRIKEIIVLASGQKAAPSFVEEHYKNIPGVKELAVFGLESKKGQGEEIHAAIVLENPEASLEQIEKEIFLRSKQIQPHLMIQKVHLISQIPRTTTLKPRRTLLKQLFSKEGENKTALHPIRNDPIHQWIGRWISENTGLSLSDIDEKDLFARLGLDSLKSLQFCEDLGEEYQLNISPTDLNENCNIEMLAAFCTKNQGTAPKTKILPTNHADPLPLSFIEESIWKYGREPSANFLWAFDFHGSLDAQAFKKAIKALFQRHEILRTTYTERERHIHREWEGTYESIDLSPLSSHEQLAKIGALIEKKQHQRINPSELPLFFLTLVQLSETEHFCLLLTSRLILDGASFYLLFDDLSRLYKNHLEKVPSLPFASPITYADFAAWQKTQDFEQQKTYWQKAFETMQPLVLPNAKKTLSLEELTQKENTLQKEIPFLIPELLMKALMRKSAQKNCSLQTLGLAAYHMALYEFTHQPLFTSRVVSMGRMRSQLKSVVGHLAGSLPIQSDFRSPLSFDEFLIQTQKNLTEANLHSDIMGEKLVELYGTFATPSPQISFNTSFNYYAFNKPLAFPNLKILPHPIAKTHLYPPGLDLDCILIPSSDKIYGMLCYRAVLFDESSFLPLIANYLKILQRIADAR